MNETIDMQAIVQQVRERGLLIGVLDIMKQQQLFDCENRITNEILQTN